MPRLGRALVVALLAFSVSLAGAQENSSPVRERARAIGEAGAAAWVPSDAASIFDWFTDQEFTTDGEGINTWTGKEGNIILKQTTGAAKPQESAGTSPNGNNTALFDGTDDELSTALAGGLFTGTQLSQPYSIGLLFKGTAAHNGIMASSTSGAVNDRVYAYFNDGSTRFNMYAGSLNVVGGTPSGGWQCGLFFYGPSGYIRIDGSNVATGNPGDDELTGLLLGDYYAGGVNFNGEIAVVAIFSAELTGGDLTGWDTWCAAQ